VIRGNHDKKPFYAIMIADNENERFLCVCKIHVDTKKNSFLNPEKACKCDSNKKVEAI